MLLCPWHKLPSQMHNSAVKPYYDILVSKKIQLLVKRLFDFLVASLMLIILSPLILVIAVAIKLDSKGPVFFTQTRVTANYKLFKIIKFRTMYENAEKNGTLVTTHNDKRVTRIGVFLRKYHLDEIPQLLNIITGDMSFVGTRPEVPKYVEKYTPEMYATLLLPAGVTSKCSIEYKDEEKLLTNTSNADEKYINEVLTQKMKINLEMIKTFSLLRELKVTIDTVLAVLGIEHKEISYKRQEESSSKTTKPDICNDLTILMSVYKEERPEYLDQALESVFNQTLKADKVVLVEDGKLTSELDKVIEKWQKQESTLVVLPFEKNRGLAVALNEGLKIIDTEYIARMDTDDICLPTRFEKQIKYLEENKEIDVVGSFISEINENNEIIKNVVKYPVTHKECFKFFAKRDPMVHPTVMFRKSFFKKIGSFYCERFVGVNKQEDSDLWYKGFLNGCLFSNYPEVLFRFRRASSFYSRRTGLFYGLVILKEKLKRCKKLGYGFSAVFYAFAYFFMSQLPSCLKKYIYQFAR